MGLDMYLRRKVYIGANYEHNDIKGEITLTRQGKPVKIIFDKVTEITENCGYWRKANQIHNWFVQNVQKGEDDCGEYYVSKDNLNELLDVCMKIKGNPTLASELLPTTQGFFFGSEDYDEWYWQDIDNTIKIINDILEDTEEVNGKTFSRGDIYYQSSW